MRIPRVFCDIPLPFAAEIELPPASAAHLIQVLRLRAGAEVILFNGDGQDRTARLIRAERRGASAQILELLAPESLPPLNIHLALGVSKGERMEFAIQKAVELGVSGITPLFTERGVVQLKGDRLEKRLEHWRQVVISACEQCGRNRLPLLQPAEPIQEWLPGVEASRRLILDHRAERGLPDLSPPEGDVQLLIGPEGGLSEPERALAARHGFAPVRLGPRVLRTETAPLAALAAIQVLWGDLR